MMVAVPFGPDPVAALLSMGLDPNVNTHADYYDVTVPDGREDEFQAALKLDPAVIYQTVRDMKREPQLSELSARELLEALTAEGVLTAARRDRIIARLKR